MTPSLQKALAAMPARQLNLIAIGIVAIAVALAWTLAIRAPLTALRQQKARLAVLEAERLRTNALRTAAAGGVAAAPLPAAPAPLELVAAVSGSAHDAGLAVAAATPGAERSVAGLRQRSLQLEASGSYAAILDWLAAIEARQPAVAVTRLALHAQDDGRRQVQLQLGAYSGEGAP
jgi:type II secretory pathway component PulM